MYNYLLYIGEADTSQTKEKFYATSKYVLLQNYGENTGTNNAGTCESSIEVHDKFMTEE